jgi:hypothetical protein
VSYNIEVEIFSEILRNFFHDVNKVISNNIDDEVILLKKTKINVFVTSVSTIRFAREKFYAAF